MGKIDKSPNNICEIPSNVSVCKGYVYLNAATSWVKSKSGDHSYCNHEKVLIGKAVVGPGEDWKSDRRMYANAKYLDMLKNDKQNDDNQDQEQEVDQLMKANRRSDEITIGRFVIIDKLAQECGIIDILNEALSYDNSRVQFVLDIALYMISEGKAVYQYFNSFVWGNATFSGKSMDKSSISKMLRKFSFSEISYFKTLWARKVLIEDGEYDNDIIVCYDSTNVNSQSDGATLVERGHAKDDPSIPQVNTDYVVREKDGMPITFAKFPGSITDVSEATSMISYFDELFKTCENYGLSPVDKDILEQIKKHIVFCCDRGYISAENVDDFDDAGLQFILLLKKTLSICDKLLSAHAAVARSVANYDKDTGYRMYTVTDYLFEEDRVAASKSDDPEKLLRYFHLIWTTDLYIAHSRELSKKIASLEKNLQRAVEQKTPITVSQFRNYSKYFNLATELYNTIEVKRGKGVSKEDMYTVKAFEKNIDAIDAEDMKCGFFILVTSKKMTAAEAYDAYHKRDCVEKVFQALKSFLGMDKEGVNCDSAMHTQALIWFVAAVLRSLILNISRAIKTDTRDRSSYTVPAILDQLGRIVADRDLVTNKYKVRYELNKYQKTILEAAGATMEMMKDYANLLTPN